MEVTYCFFPTSVLRVGIVGTASSSTGSCTGCAERWRASPASGGGRRSQGGWLRESGRSRSVGGFGTVAEQSALVCLASTRVQGYVRHNGAVIVMGCMATGSKRFSTVGAVELVLVGAVVEAVEGEAALCENKSAMVVLAALTVGEGALDIRVIWLKTRPRGFRHDIEWRRNEGEQASN
jgi:hypothetical protein